MIILILANGLRRGRRWAWVLSVILAVFNVLTGAALPRAVCSSRVLRSRARSGDVSVAIAQSALWPVLLVYLIWVRGAFRARRKATVGAGAEPSVDDVKEQLRTHGGGTLSWMTTWDGNSYARTSDGIVAYQKRAGVAIVLADPLGPAASRADIRRASSSRWPSAPG